MTITTLNNGLMRCPRCFSYSEPRLKFCQNCGIKKDFIEYNKLIKSFELDIQAIHKFVHDVNNSNYFRTMNTVSKKEELIILSNALQSAPKLNRIESTSNNTMAQKIKTKPIFYFIIVVMVFGWLVTHVNFVLLMILLGVLIFIGLPMLISKDEHKLADMRSNAIDIYALSALEWLNKYSKTYVQLMDDTNVIHKLENERKKKEEEITDMIRNGFYTEEERDAFVANIAAIKAEEQQRNEFSVERMKEIIWYIECPPNKQALFNARADLRKLHTHNQKEQDVVDYWYRVVNDRIDNALYSAYPLV